MAQRSWANELRQWAETEMELSAHQLPSIATCRRLCVSSSHTDIWKFVIRHVHNSKNVKKIEGNVRWYQYVEETRSFKETKDKEQKNKKTLVADISKIKAELQDLDLNLKMGRQAVTAHEYSMEVNYEKLKDVQRRTLLLRAYLRKKEQEKAKLQTTSQLIQNRVTTFQEMSRKSSMDIKMGLQKSKPCLAGSVLPDLEPAVLRDVKAATLMRYQFMKTLADDSIIDTFCGEKNKEFYRNSHHQWLSIMEGLLHTHPANHILAALEHLAQQNARELQELTASTDIDSEIATLKFRFEKSHLEDISEPTDMLPSVQSLIQEGWGECEELWVQQFSLRAQVKDLSSQLATVVQEVHELLSNGSARDAFELELRTVHMKACRDALLNQCRALEDEACAKKIQLHSLKKKQQQIREFRQLVDKRQEQIQILIKGNSCSKSQLQKSQKEVQQFVQMKLMKPEKEIELHLNGLHAGIEHEMKQFLAIFLPSLQRVTLDREQRVSVHELSLHRLDWMAPPNFHVIKGICQSLGFPLYKAPDMFLLHVSNLKAELLSLQGRAMIESQALSNLQQQILYQEPEALALIKRIKGHDAVQIRELVPLIKHLTQQCSKYVGHAKLVQKLINDWLDQPAQFALSWERRHGLTMKEWMERWTLAVKNLQRQPLNLWA